MVHGPCRVLNPNAPCMKKNKCIHSFPKPFQEQTTMDHDGYPRYAWPNDGHVYEVRGFMLDNRWIVPYNPFCTLWLDCHVNIECPICFGSMKYLNKYIDKGGDCGTLSIHDHHNEVKQYIDGRYFSASEAAWHIFQFNMHGKYKSHIIIYNSLYSFLQRSRTKCSSPWWTAYCIWPIYWCTAHYQIKRKIWHCIDGLL